MLADAKAGLFEKIVVWRPDRLFRGLTPAAKLSKVLDETGIQIEGVMQPLDRRIELRFKLPVHGTQVADTILTLSRNNTTFGNNNYESIRVLDAGLEKV